MKKLEELQAIEECYQGEWSELYYALKYESDLKMREKLLARVPVVESLLDKTHRKLLTLINEKP